MSDESKTFDPSRYLTKIGPADYLEVRWRLLWLRTDHPDAVIETECLHRTEDSASFKATIWLSTGAKATGHGNETRADFREFYEKAETKAIGRALSALGFGTQFSTDHEFSDGTNKVVDSPIDFANTQGRRLALHGQAAQRTPQHATNGNGGPPQEGTQATEKQINYIKSLARDLGYSDEDLATEIEHVYGGDLTSMSRRDASAYVEKLKSTRPLAEVGQ